MYSNIATTKANPMSLLPLTMLFHFPISETNFLLWFSIYFLLWHRIFGFVLPNMNIGKLSMIHRFLKLLCGKPQIYKALGVYRLWQYCTGLLFGPWHFARLNIINNFRKKNVQTSHYFLRWTRKQQPAINKNQLYYSVFHKLLQIFLHL